ncbi:MAG: hypothetical protein JRD94_00370 [Deltaproteobacteria bacterium]|nr:hypothetical protein [Deltaproteobacteria bacterium]
MLSQGFEETNGHYRARRGCQRTCPIGAHESEEVACRVGGFLCDRRDADGGDEDAACPEESTAYYGTCFPENLAASL